jgi:alkylation response protein AidB-like acyl-CoA dehydrogenase
MNAPEEIALRLVRHSAKAFIEKHRARIDAIENAVDPSFPNELLDECVELGWTGPLADEAEPDESPAILAALINELGLASPSLATRLLCHHDARFWLEGATLSRRTESPPAWLGLSSFCPPSSWSQSRLLLEGDRLDGSLSFLVGGQETVRFLVTARHPDQTVSLVSLNERDLPKPVPITTLGLRGLWLFDLQVAHSSRIPYTVVATGSIVGKAREESLKRVMPAYAALCRSILVTCLKTAETHAATRRQGGGFIADLPNIREKLSLIERNIELSQLMERALLSEPNSRMDALTGLRQMLLQGTDAGLQVLGGAGYVVGSGQERLWRDARQLAALFGTHLGLLG